jgi:hypothetical protein
MSEPNEPGRIFRPRNELPWAGENRARRGASSSGDYDDDSQAMDEDTPGVYEGNGYHDGATWTLGYGPSDSYAGSRAPGMEMGAAAAAQESGADNDFDVMTRDDIKIGLWGGPQSGKTTYLAALRHATNSATCGTWNVMPMSVQSSNLMYELSQGLNKGRFPDATQVGTVMPLRWLFQGDLTGTEFARRRMGRRAAAKSRFVLNLADVSGMAFAYRPEDLGVSRKVAEQALTDLTNADGLIYLFDPIGERDNRDSMDYVNRTITQMKLQHAKKGSSDRHLPHHVSICITKFDHPQVFQEARDKGLVESGPDGLPRVPDRNARDFFTMLCTGKFWSKHYEQGERSAQFILNELQATFGEDKIHYFVTSSIGFWKPMGWSGELADFNPDDFANYMPGDEATQTPPSIRGAISPINVLEPLVKLHQRIERQRPKRRA